MRFRFIEDHRTDSLVRTLCEVLEVSLAGYYAWRSRPESRRSAANRKLVEDIRRVHRNACGRYGSPPIHVELTPRAAGRASGRIERLMRHHGIRAIMARPRWVRTTDSRHDLPMAPNLLDLRRRRAEPGLACRHHLRRDRSGMALTRRGDGPLQLQDCRLGNGGSFASRPAVGSLADGDLGAATWCRPDPPFRSRRPNRGVQSASVEYRKLLQYAGFKASMSREADCYDNASMESFFHTLKTVLVYHTHYATRAEATRDIFAYIEGFYNRTRRHSGIGYISPVEMELEAA